MKFAEWAASRKIPMDQMQEAEATWYFAYHQGAYDKEIECTERTSKDYAERETRIVELEQQLAAKNEK